MDRDILPTQALKSLLDSDNEHDSLMGDHEDEDILSVLSKPVEVVIAKKVFLFFITTSETKLNIIFFSSEFGFENLDGPLTSFTTWFKTTLRWDFSSCKP